MTHFKTLLLLLATLLMNASRAERVTLLGAASIFGPILADPKWPRFSLGYRRNQINNFGKSYFAPTIGAVLPMVRWGLPDNVVEFSIHGGVFATMDISSSQSRLINSDYHIGPAVAYKTNSAVWLFKFSHTSAHIGDELLLSQSGRSIKRIDLSYEIAELILARDCDSGFRPYAGVGYIVHADPISYQNAEWRVGFDFLGPRAIFAPDIRPVFGVHCKFSRNYQYPQLSIKGGLEVKERILVAKSLQLLLEYYQGSSNDGQFYTMKDRYFGVSLNLNF